MQKLVANSDVALLIGRLFYSSLFLLHGVFKLIDYAGTVGYMNGNGLPAPALFAILAIIIELGGGILMLLGYQTRPAALCIAFGVLVAALIRITHSGEGGELAVFMKNMAIVGGSLAFFVSGAGAYSVDERK